MAAVPPSSSIADRMRERIEFIRMREAGMQPAEIVKEASAEGQEKLKAYGQQLNGVLQSRQKQMQNVVQVLVNDVVDENVLKAAEEQVTNLTTVHAEAQQMHENLNNRIKDGKQCLQEQFDQKKILSAQLQKLKKLAKGSFPGPEGTQILTAGSKMCNNLANNAS